MVDFVRREVRVVEYKTGEYDLTGALSCHLLEYLRLK